jgi:hypothetical protein
MTRASYALGLEVAFGNFSVKYADGWQRTGMAGRLVLFGYVFLPQNVIK